MKCIFCHTNIDKKPSENFWTCKECGTTQETKLIDRPYTYTIGNGASLEAPHVKAQAVVNAY